MGSPDRVGWGVIGACGIAKRRTIPEGIVPARNATLRAVTDIDRDGAREIAEKFDARPCTSVEELLGDDQVRAVYIATPNDLHKAQAQAAAAAGKHVFCEKPLAPTTADIIEMIDACEQAGVLLGVGLMMRFNVYHQKIREMIRQGAMGTPLFGRGQMTSWHPPRPTAWRHDPKQGGGCFMDVGSHVVDVLEMFFGRTKSIFCQCATRVHDSPVDDTALAQLTFESGAFGMIDVSFAVPSQANEYVLEVYGSKGAIKGKYSLAQLPGGELRASILDDLGGFEAQEKARYKKGYEPFELETRNTYQAEFEAFSQAILDGGPAPVSGRDGLWNHTVVDAAYESARTGRPVEPKSE